MERSQATKPPVYGAQWTTHETLSSTLNRLAQEGRTIMQVLASVTPQYGEPGFVIIYTEPEGAPSGLPQSQRGAGEASPARKN